MTVFSAGKLTLLQIVQAACDEMGITSPTLVIGNTDAQVKQLLALAQREGEEMSQMGKRQGGWQELHKEYTFTTVNGTAAYAMPTDFEYFIEQTFWDGSYRWQLLGPLEAQEKNVLKYGISPVGPRRRFWVLNNQMVINPTPTTTGDLIAYDYYSNAWAQSSGGAAQQRFLADTDNYMLDDNLMILGLIWRFKNAKGFDYQQDYSMWDNATRRVMARNGGSRSLPLNATSSGINLLSSANVPDTGFGS